MLPTSRVGDRRSGGSVQMLPPNRNIVNSMVLELGAWCFSGSWNLALGDFESFSRLHVPELSRAPKVHPFDNVQIPVRINAHGMGCGEHRRIALIVGLICLAVSL